MRVEKWQKNAQLEGTEAVSGIRDVPEAGQQADATEVFPAARPFQVTDEAPTTGTGPGGSGAGWFGNGDDAARSDAGALGAVFRRPGEFPTRADAPRTADRPSPDAAGTRLLASHGSADADRTEVLGDRIGQDRMGREGIARDRTDPDGTARGGIARDHIARDHIAQDRTAQGRTDRDGTQRWRDPLDRGRITWGANQSGFVPDGPRPNRANPSPTTPSRTVHDGTPPSATNPNGTDPAGANPDHRHPGYVGPNGADPTGPVRRTAAPDADRTDVLPPVTPATPPVSPTRAFPTTAPGPATAALRDPWQDIPDADAGAAAAADHTHDPHEVTVQLDAVQLGDGVLRRADGPQPGKIGPEGSDGPVFVDASGRRSRLYRRLGIAVGVVCAIYAVVIVSTLLSGNSNAPWLPVDGQQEGKPAGQVDTTPLPSRSAQPSGTGSAAPRTSPSAGTGVTTAPGADAPAPGASGSARQPGTSAGPEPSETSGGTEPGGSGGTTAPNPTQSTQEPPPASTDPSTPVDGGEPTVDPTGPAVDPTTGTDPGGDTIANGASDSHSTVVAGPAASDTTRTSPHLSPENTL